MLCSQGTKPPARVCGSRSCCLRSTGCLQLHYPRSGFHLWSGWGCLRCLGLGYHRLGLRRRFQSPSSWFYRRGRTRRVLGTDLPLLPCVLKGCRRALDMVRTVWRVGNLLYIIAVMSLCFRLATRIDLCIRKASFFDSLCCLIAWESRFLLIGVCAGVGGLACSLLALRSGRENVQAGGFIGVVVGSFLGGVLQDIARYCCR